jgi:hypothetical protein
MNSNDFNVVVENQIQRSREVLTSKSKSYNTDDRLSAFKIAAALQGITPKEALAGMMAKHTGSVYKMCSNEGPYTLDEWTEKITDHINYLLNLRAMVEEEALGALREKLSSPSNEKSLKYKSPFPNSIPC